MSAKWEEMIVVAPCDEVFFGFKSENDLRFQGVETDKVVVDTILRNFGGTIKTMRRGDKNDPTPADNNAEINYDHKQLITYAAVTKYDKNGELNVFAYERLSGGGESRLHNKLSVGVGGHMNALFDADNYMAVIMEEADRELNEELNFNSIANTWSASIDVLGLINDDENEVGKVHLGVMLVMEVDELVTVEVKETEQLAGRWYKLSELFQPETFERLESWSQIAVNALSRTHWVCDESEE